MSTVPALARGQLAVHSAFQAAEIKLASSSYPVRPSSGSRPKLRGEGSGRLLAPVGGIAEFKRLFRARLPHIGVVGIALSASDMLSTYPLLMDSQEQNIGLWAVFILLNSGFMFAIPVAALTAAQVWFQASLRRVLWMMIAVVACGIVTSGLRAWFSLNPFLGLGDVYGDQLWSDDRLGLFLSFLWVAIAFSSLLALLYESQDRAERVNDTLQRARLDGELAERQTLEARLNILKARVDPEFLFDVIGRLESLYAADAGAAERLLDDLIAFLRASLPPTSAGFCTLHHEVQICSAFLLIERALRTEGLTIQLKIDLGAVNGGFPPAMLLPLLQQLLGERRPGAAPAHVLIAIERHADRTQIELACQPGAQAVSEEALATARLALQAFTGNAARVSANAGPFGGQTIIIEVPNVSA
jgi:hypothetical protein